MALFRTHRQSAKATNRVIGLFFSAIAIVAALFVVVVALHYVLGWW
jgi:uncharacterized membrane protein required for colicin V production